MNLGDKQVRGKDVRAGKDLHESQGASGMCFKALKKKFFPPCDNPACVTDHCDSSLRPPSELNR